MAGYENIKDKGFDKRTTDELRVIAANGGRASGKARRRKADFRRTLNLLLTTEIDSPEWTPVLEAMGLDSTLESAVNAAMIQEALMGNVKAYEAIAKYSGQSDKPDKVIGNPKEKENAEELQRLSIEEQKARINYIKAKTDKLTGNNQEIEDMDDIEGDLYGSGN